MPAHCRERQRPHRDWSQFVTSLLILALATCWTAIGHGVEPMRGSLVIVGGGEVPADIANRFVSLAGGSQAEVVLIPTASDKSEAIDRAMEGLTKTFGLKRVIVLHTTDRLQADTESFVAPLTRASGVWISGGRHWRLVDSYLGTRTEREIKAVYERGGVIGGTSAGATIMGSFLVRGAREGNHIMVAPDYQRGFGLLDRVAIDQHILPRGRADGMAPVVAANPGLLGLGIDESTAAVVTGNRLEVVGRSVVAINDGREHDGKPYYFLATGEQFDLASRTRVAGGKKRSANTAGD